MSHQGPRLEDLFMTRREMLRRCGIGMGTLGLASLLSSEGSIGSAQADSLTDGVNPLSPRPPHYKPRIKRVIHLFMNGGPSQVDTFDPKPMLTQYHGKKVPELAFPERTVGAAFKSPFTFQKYGQSGIEVSEIFPHLAKHVDDLCIIRSMHADNPVHEFSLMLLNCGDGTRERPSMGSWVLYGLGTVNQNLPGFVVMCPGGLPVKEASNWRSAFLPGVYQGTYVDTANTRIEKLIENIRNSRVSAATQRAQLDLVQEMNRQHLAERERDAQLEARIASMELAFRMQMEASDAFDASREPQYIQERYGPGTQARQILIGRRLLERGVRYVQVWHGAGQPWDAHQDIAGNHRQLAKESDQAISALLVDLKERGMWEDTLVLWGGEFGRTPAVETNGNANGRDHSHHGYTMWMAGGAVKAGHIHGATDDFGFKAVKDPVHVHDLQATILHLLGLNHEKLTYRFAGRDYRLTDLDGRVVPELLA
ncbi:MAG TPA: DUF1501 domain-containing protein [Chthonomonadaceae bacterium]|nr:DUF1501 domain-containing protein [Chthonomonadaceae bacterium]